MGHTLQELFLVHTSPLRRIESGRLAQRSNPKAPPTTYFGCCDMRGTTPNPRAQHSWCAMVPDRGSSMWPMWGRAMSTKVFQSVS